MNHHSSPLVVHIDTLDENSLTVHLCSFLRTHYSIPLVLVFIFIYHATIIKLLLLHPVVSFEIQTNMILSVLLSIHVVLVTRSLL